MISIIILLFYCKLLMEIYLLNTQLDIHSSDPRTSKAQQTKEVPITKISSLCNS